MITFKYFVIDFLQKSYRDVDSGPNWNSMSWSDLIQFIFIFFVEDPIYIWIDQKGSIVYERVFLWFNP